MYNSSNFYQTNQRMVSQTLNHTSNQTKQMVDQLYYSMQCEQAELSRRRSILINKKNEKYQALKFKRHKLELENIKLQNEQKRLEEAKSSKWYNDRIKSSNPVKIITINVGGQIFQTSSSVLQQEPDSILASLCDDDCEIIHREPDGSYYIERDWWIFRYLLNYLRNKDLPHKRETLLELYKEAAYWNLKVLQSDIYFRLHSNDINNLQPKFEPIITPSTLQNRRSVFSYENQRGLLQNPSYLLSTWSITQSNK